VSGKDGGDVFTRADINKGGERLETDEWVRHPDTQTSESETTGRRTDNDAVIFLLL